jgi:hypothetical protein
LTGGGLQTIEHGPSTICCAIGPIFFGGDSLVSIAGKDKIAPASTYCGYGAKKQKPLPHSRRGFLVFSGGLIVVYNQFFCYQFIVQYQLQRVNTGGKAL